MPVKIDTVTDVNRGTVAQVDLYRMIWDYGKHVVLGTIPPHAPVIRTESIHFKATEILELLKVPEDVINSLNLPYNGFRIHLSVYPEALVPPVCSEDYRNHLCVCLVPSNNENDDFSYAALIPGFRSGFGKLIDECCGNMNPPPRSSVDDFEKKIAEAGE